MNIMRTAVLLLLALLAIGASGALADTYKLAVLTSIPPLGEFVAQVGGDRVDLQVLIPPGAEPHTFEPLPSQMEMIEKADVYFQVGAGLEGWMNRIAGANPDLKVVDTSQGVDLIYGTQHEHDEEEGSTSDDAGNGTANPDPHIWLSPLNAMIQVNNICDGLVEADPEGRDYYLTNRDRYLNELQTLDEYMASRLGGGARRVFLVNHPAWSYLARDYGLVQLAIKEEEREPGPRYLAQLVQRARSENINVVFVEPQFNPVSAQTLAREIGGRVETLDPLAADYLENMRIVADRIGSSLD